MRDQPTPEQRLKPCEKLGCGCFIDSLSRLHPCYRHMLERRGMEPNDRTVQPTPEQTPERIAPPSDVVARAIEMARCSPCRSKRGAVAFRRRQGAIVVISAGFNRRQAPPCDGSAACKQSCGRTALHAEQDALLDAGRDIEGADVLHVKVNTGGSVVASGGPSCLECSKLMFAAGVSGVWLFHETGWRRYDIEEFHRLTLASADALTATLAHLTQERDEWRASASGYGSDAVEWKIRAEQAEGTLAHLKEQAMKIPVWKCKACGCLWRDNLDDTVSLLNVRQKSCQRCEHLPTRTACEIHWLDAALVDPPVSSSTEQTTKDGR